MSFENDPYYQLVDLIYESSTYLSGSGSIIDTLRINAHIETLEKALKTAPQEYIQRLQDDLKPPGNLDILQFLIDNKDSSSIGQYYERLYIYINEQALVLLRMLAYNLSRPQAEQEVYLFSKASVQGLSDPLVLKIINDANNRRNPAPPKPPVQSSTYTSSSSSASSSSGDCFVVTATYGSVNAPEVYKYRNFRDQYLQKHWLGRLFVRVYYRPVGPFLASIVKVFPPIKKVSCSFLEFGLKHLPKDC